MKTLQRLSILFLSLSLGVAAERSALAQHGDHAAAPPQEQKAKKEFQGDPYLLDTDPVTGKKLGPLAEQRILDHEGRELRFADERNEKTFREDPAKYLPKVDAAMIEQQAPHYSLLTCPVSGEKLGDMGKPIDFLYKNRLVRFCCGECKSEFLKDPAKYVAKLDAAVIEAQAKAYPVKTCVVSGEAFGGDMGEPVDYILGNRMVRVCCKSCVKKLRKDPLTYLKKVEAAKKAAEPHHGEGKAGEHKHGDRK
jgi:YHS domain-containing protein